MILYEGRDGVEKIWGVDAGGAPVAGKGRGGEDWGPEERGVPVSRGERSHRVSEAWLVCGGCPCREGGVRV